MLELLPELELYALGQHRKFSNRARTPIQSLCHIFDRDVALFPAFSAVEPGGYRINRKHTAFRIAQCSPRPATGTCYILSYRHWMCIHIPSANVCLIKSSTGILAFFAFRAPGGGGGLSPGARAVHTQITNYLCRCVRLDVYKYTHIYQLFM